MNLIEEIEISYFRSFYKFKMKNLKELNVIFGKNDSGKSNVVRALNLFFSETPDHTQSFDFAVDFCDQRRQEAEASEDVRKFLYVKITFNTPPSYQPSLGKQFYVKRQWTVSRGQEYIEEISNSIPTSRRHIATRFLNKIRFIYIPAIKDIRIFEMLLAGIHEAVANSKNFVDAVDHFTDHLQALTSEMFSGLPKEVSVSTKIGPPTQLSQLFKTLDFETKAVGEVSTKSLTRQRGDGVKVRHIPELLNFISKNDSYDYHIWGFEEPENSLDFVAAQSEAPRLLALAKTTGVQIFVTTHSPSFYLLHDKAAERFYVSKDERGLSNNIQGKELESLDVQQAIGDGFYLPAVAKALEKVSKLENSARESELQVEKLRDEIRLSATPIVFTEGRTDAAILSLAWKKRRSGEPPFIIRSCETTGENSDSGNGGAQSLAIRLKGIGAEHPHPVIGVFDNDAEGQKAVQLDKNFDVVNLSGCQVRRSKNGLAFAFCLPAPSFRKECDEHGNLPIEYLFRDEHLSLEVDGKKLKLRPQKATAKVGTKVVQLDLDDLTHFKLVGGGKSDFANIIVPTLPRTAFDAFDAVFDLIEAILRHRPPRGR